MKTVQFLMDYRGKLTGEIWYAAGTVVELEDAIADQLIADGRAVLMPPQPPIAPVRVKAKK